MKLTNKELFKASLAGNLEEIVNDAMRQAFEVGFVGGHEAGIYNNNYWDINREVMYNNAKLDELKFEEANEE